MRISRQLFQKLPPLLALALSVSLFVPGSVYGQTSLSLQAGASLATLGGSDVASADSRIGMRVGASAIFPFSANLDLQFGAAYAAKGATEQELGVDVAFELDYFEIPLLLRLSPSVDGTISPMAPYRPTSLSDRHSLFDSSAAGLDQQKGSRFQATAMNLKMSM